jgi:hypothetical protein
MKTKTKQEFLNGLMIDADHHAKSVISSITTIWMAMDAKDINVKKWRSHTCWVESKKDLYFFTYNHETKSIEVKLRSQKGPLIKSLNDKHKNIDVWNLMMSL